MAETVLRGVAVHVWFHRVWANTPILSPHSTVPTQPSPFETDSGIVVCINSTKEQTDSVLP